MVDFCIKLLIQYLQNRYSAITVHCKIYTENEHSINQEAIDHDALSIIFHLKEHGHTAYLVGGSVRDLLLGKTPKDYDISTSAKPEEIKHIFQRRCLLIGKRFRLAHIRAGKKIFEVSTFRAGDLESSALIVRDNRWGTAEEDVLRRDFTINALFYDPTTRTVLDYVGGCHDIKEMVLRTIGDPVARFKQDPVRMIRLIKFQARFDFAIEHKTEKALKLCQEEIMKSAPERILEEVFRMLETASSKRFFELMAAFGFLEVLFPCFHHFLTGSQKKHGYDFLHAVDSITTESSDPIDRSCLLAALAFPILEKELHTLSEDRQSPLSFAEVITLSESLLQGIDTSSFAHFPRKLLSSTHSVLINQFRLTPLKGNPKFHSRFSSSFEFEQALTFLQIRAHVDKELHHIYLDWKKARKAT